MFEVGAIDSSSGSSSKDKFGLRQRSPLNRSSDTGVTIGIGSGSGHATTNNVAAVASPRSDLNVVTEVKQIRVGFISMDKAKAVFASCWLFSSQPGWQLAPLD